ncbi:hypothetical protein [Streptomyces sp. UH6]|uniref:hypothetical protein n=1 Tax=Streptomyces sp. UH6 TaxID=2748379 RepID=UPI0015D4AAC0|nr:hypothetical protein [Streptomyces sp. UH6]NYV72993.1 hypothetical protein [Streptomyces sp. UH6]
MAEASWPSPAYNDRSVTDAEYEALSARFSDDGIYGSPSDAAVVTAAAGLNVQIAAGAQASVRGHYWTAGSTPFTLPVTSNSSGQTRYDMVVLRLDRSTWQVTAAVRQGTPGSSAPALVRDTGGTGLWEVPLAQVTVPNGAIAVTVQRREMYVGARIRPATSSALPLFPHRGEQAFETDTGRLRMWTGSAWATVWAPTQSVTVDATVSGWATSVSSILDIATGTAHLRLGTWERTGGTVSGATDTRLPVLIPSQYRDPTRSQYAVAYITGAKVGRLTIYAANSDRAGQVWLTQHPDISTDDFVLPGTGISWAVV